MHVESIAQAAIAGQPAAPPAPPSPEAALRQDAQRQAQQALQDARQAGQEARSFRIEKDGKIVTVGPEGVVVTNVQPAGTAQPAIAPPIPGVPPEAVAISIAFFVMVVLVVIGWPIARAIARRMDRATVAPPRGAADNTEQLRRIEQAVEAMAIEVERVSENQRFVTRLLAEGRPDELRLAQAAGGSAGESRAAERATSEPPPVR